MGTVTVWRQPQPGSVASSIGSWSSTVYTIQYTVHSGSPPTWILHLHLAICASLISHLPSPTYPRRLTIWTSAAFIGSDKDLTALFFETICMIQMDSEKLLSILLASGFHFCLLDAGPLLLGQFYTRSVDKVAQIKRLVPRKRTGISRHPSPPGMYGHTYCEYYLAAWLTRTTVARLACPAVRR